MLHLAHTHATCKVDDSASFAAGVCRQFLFIFSLNCQKKSSSSSSSITSGGSSRRSNKKTRPAPLAESDWGCLQNLPKSDNRTWKQFNFHKIGS
jgi:hypothetical protein